MDDREMRVTEEGRSSFERMLEEAGASELQVARFKRLSDVGKVFVTIALGDPGTLTTEDVLRSAEKTDRKRRA